MRRPAGPAVLRHVPQDVVIGEAVPLELPPAGLGVRLLSCALDVVVTVLVLSLAVGVAGQLTLDSDEALTVAVTLATTVLVLVGLPTCVETATGGLSIGKLAFGLRTVRDDAGAISFRHALTRALVGVVELWATFGVPAVVSSLFSSHGKRLGDVAAGTYVVRERLQLHWPAPAAMPEALADWAAHADIAPLPDDLTLAVRQFLQRRDDFSAATRAAVAGELCSDVLGYVSPAPHPGSPAEHVLAAVLAERRRRDWERLCRDDARRRRLLRGVS